MAWNPADYETVETRLFKFWDRYPDGRVETHLHAFSDTTYIVSAAIYRDNGPNPFATGLAQETVGSTNVNKTSALENCETSAIGRALANGGFAPKGARPSREEMEKANRGDNGEPAQTIKRRPGTLTPAAQQGLEKLEEIGRIEDSAERITRIADWKARAGGLGVLDETTMINGSLITLARYADALATGALTTP